MFPLIKKYLFAVLAMAVLALVFAVLDVNHTAVEVLIGYTLVWLFWAFLEFFRRREEMDAHDRAEWMKKWGIILAIGYAVIIVYRSLIYFLGG